MYTKDRKTMRTFSKTTCVTEKLIATGTEEKEPPNGTGASVYALSVFGERIHRGEII